MFGILQSVPLAVTLELYEDKDVPPSEG